MSSKSILVIGSYTVSNLECIFISRLNSLVQYCIII